MVLNDYTFTFTLQKRKKHCIYLKTPFLVPGVGPSIFKRHMKMRSSRVNNAHETRLKHVEYEGNTGLKRPI